MKHGHNKVGKKTPEYITWGNMVQRCSNLKHPGYKNYGKRGIKVCKRWLIFENFFKDMGVRPSGRSLDRIDNDGNYESDNCRWATTKEQRANMRPISCGPCKQRLFIAMNFQGTMAVSDNQHKFAEQRGLRSENISACLCGKRSQHEGWVFRRFENKT